MVISKKIIALLVIAGIFTSCKKDVDPIIVVPPSSGASLQLNGIAGTEAGSSAGNTVFVDLSTAKQTAIARSSWDLGFYSGTDFRVIINNTTSATAKVLAKNDLTLVGKADTVGLNSLALGFDPSAYALVDNILGSLTGTVIPAISAVDAENKVIILNPGTAGGVPARDWYKIRILRTSTGYKLQHAKLAATSFATLDIARETDFNFKYVSLDGGNAVNVEPEKELWDFKWSYALYQTALGGSTIPYAFSDLVMINHHAGVQAAEVLTTAVTYENYVKANVSTTTFSNSVDAIGSRWRSTSPATGVKTNAFYVVKDPGGNVYKIKFLAMGAGDGGTRGKPQLEYRIVD